MGTNHMGRQSIRFPQPPVVRGFASVAGKKEREGPLGDQFTERCRTRHSAKRAGSRPSGACSR